MTSSQLIPVLIVSLIVWRSYQRIRRSIGRQKFNEKRAWISVVIISSVFALIAFGTERNGSSIWSLAAGLGGGVALAGSSYRFTRFEHNADGGFYFPNSYFGVAVSLILIGRLAYRWMAIAHAGGSPASQFGQSPLTLALFGLTFGYYLGFAVFLIYEFRWNRKFVTLHQN